MRLTQANKIMSLMVSNVRWKKKVKVSSILTRAWLDDMNALTASLLPDQRTQTNGCERRTHPSVATLLCSPCGLLANAASWSALPLPMADRWRWRRNARLRAYRGQGQWPDRQIEQTGMPRFGVTLDAQVQEAKGDGEDCWCWAAKPMGTACTW